LQAKLPYIHLLSMDVLSRIFLFCTVDYENLQVSKTTIAIGGVCKKWRKVVGRVARCWAHLPKIDHVLQPMDDWTFSQLQRHIKRSQKAPHTATLVFMAGQDKSDGDVEMVVDSEEVVDVGRRIGQYDAVNSLIPILPRIQSLDIQTTHGEAQKIGILGQVEFTDLEELSIQLCDHQYIFRRSQTQ